MTPLVPVLVAMLAGLAATLAAFTVFSSIAPAPDPLRALEAYDQGPQPVHRTYIGSRQGRFATRLVGTVGSIAGRQGYIGMVRQKLEQAGIPLRPAETITVHLVGVIFSPLVIVLLTGNLVLAILASSAAALLPVLFLESAVARRQKAFSEQLPDVLGLIAGSLRGGYGISQALALVVEEALPPASVEIRRGLAEARLGLPLEDALDKVAERMDDDDFRWVVSALRIQREVGGNLAELLDTVATTVRERESTRRHIRGLTSEGRLSAIILVGLPIVEALALMAFNRSYIEPLITTPFGWMMIGAVTLLLFVGLVLLQAINRIEV